MSDHKVVEVRGDGVFGALTKLLEEATLYVSALTREKVASLRILEHPEVAKLKMEVTVKQLRKESRAVDEWNRTYARPVPKKPTEKKDGPAEALKEGTKPMPTEKNKLTHKMTFPKLEQLEQKEEQK